MQKSKFNIAMIDTIGCDKFSGGIHKNYIDIITKLAKKYPNVKSVLYMGKLLERLTEKTFEIGNKVNLEPRYFSPMAKTEGVLTR